MNEYLISKLKQGRINKGLKQSDVTKCTGIKNTTLSNYENGITEPDIDTFLQLCEFYELDYAEVLAEAYGLSVQGEDFKIRPSEIEHVKKYRFISEYSPDSAKMIDAVLNNTYKTIEQIDQLKKENSQQSIIDYEEHIIDMRLINYYYRVASAGTGQIIFDMPPTKRIEIPNIPEYRKVDYAIGVNGTSMEPTYHDGDMLLVEMAEEVEIGEIGIFRVDNESYVKKLGETELISLNPAAKNIPLNETSGCMGRVIGKLPKD